MMCVQTFRLLTNAAVYHIRVFYFINTTFQYEYWYTGFYFDALFATKHLLLFHPYEAMFISATSKTYYKLTTDT